MERKKKKKGMILGHILLFTITPSEVRAQEAEIKRHTVVIALCLLLLACKFE